MAEFGTVYRYEMSGELHGLTRVRGFTQDDAHIFCRPDQVKEEFQKAMIGIYTRTFSACGYRAGRFLEMVNTRGGLETAKILLREEEPRGGFVALHEQGRLDGYYGGINC